MNLTVNMDKKSIQTEPIKRLMIQGEALADVVSLTLPLVYGDIDLSLLNYSIRGTSEDAETTVTQALSKSVTELAVVLEWVISSAFTAIPGELKLVLVGSDEAGDTIIKCDGESVYVRADPSVAGFAEASANAYEQLVAQINYQIAHLQVIRILGTYATLSALEAAVTSPSNGDMYNVGSSAPYTVYVWTGSWVNLGQLKGDPGTNGTPGTDGVGIPTGGTINQILYKTSGTNYSTGWKTMVAADVGAPSYSASQSLSDSEKSQARTNIGAEASAVVTSEKTDDYTVLSSDNGAKLVMNSSSNKTFTFATQAVGGYADGTIVFLKRKGTGTVTIAGSAGVTFESAGSRMKIAEQYGWVFVRKISTDLWEVVGNTGA